MVDGKVALVTGAGRGIGEASARLFAAEGATVVVADIDGSTAEAVASVDPRGWRAGEFGPGRRHGRGERRRHDRRRLERHGRIDCAHNNAGISGQLTSFTELSLDDWHRMIAINLTSVFLCLKHELLAMVPAGSGAIVNTSSGAGVVGFGGLPHYVAAKHGVLGLTKSAAQEYAKAGIRVNAICPGTTRTPMIESFIAGNPDIERMVTRGIGRGVLGEPDEVAQAAVWLCSDRASFVSGESMLVDGATICR